MFQDFQRLFAVMAKMDVINMDIVSLLDLIGDF